MRSVERHQGLAGRVAYDCRKEWPRNAWCLAGLVAEGESEEPN